MHDLIIIGAGPAGMTAAVYAARKRLDLLIIGKDVGGQTAWSPEVDNYLGYRYISGMELVEKFEDHLKSFDIKHEYRDVGQLLKTDDGFSVITSDGKEYEARAVIVASGKTPRMLGVPGEREYIGRGVAYCAVCDAPLFERLDVAVVGGGNSGLDTAGQLIRIANKVYIIEFSEALKADEVLIQRVEQAGNTEIILGAEVKEIAGEKMVSGVVLEDRGTRETRRIPVGGVFVAVGSDPSVAFISGLVALNDRNEIEVDCACRTKVPGLFAAGDVTSVPGKQIIIAAGQGAQAALSAYDYLVRNRKLG